MSGAPDNHELARQLAVLEERMNTHQAEYRTDIARLAEDIAQRDGRRDVEAARRENRMLLAIFLAAGLIIGAVAVL